MSKQFFSNISRVGAESAPTFTILGRKAPSNIINKGSRENPLQEKQRGEDDEVMKNSEKIV